MGEAIVYFFVLFVTQTQMHTFYCNQVKLQTTFFECEEFIRKKRINLHKTLATTYLTL